MSRKLKLGMIGGGEGSFIGGVHRMAARLDNHYELVCGVFSSDAERSKRSGQALGLDDSRIYATYQELFQCELALPVAERVEVISIVTPNHVHVKPAIMALRAGMDVIMDKPMAFSLAEAKELAAVAAETGRKVCLTHTYTGYPMIKEARSIVKEGRLGKVRKIYVEYPQGWLSQAAERNGNKQADWRTDPDRSGIAGAMGDIGTHAFNLAEYISGLQVTQICASLHTVVEGRRLDDDGDILLRFNQGASGVLFATQVAAGEENNLRIRIYGEEGGLEWSQNDANSLYIKWLDRPMEVLRTGASYLSSFASHNTRTPAGHPEGYIEAFANLYRNFALHLKAESTASESVLYMDYPSIDEGVRGMAFIENVIASNRSTEKWFDFTI